MLDLSVRMVCEHVTEAASDNRLSSPSQSRVLYISLISASYVHRTESKMCSLFGEVRLKGFGHRGPSSIYLKGWLSHSRSLMTVDHGKCDGYGVMFVVAESSSASEKPEREW